ncbi:MAG: amino acid permease, partial [Candidatus Eremiobacteraeota bacterium]|nr:amino acid permease [Candidatus Eremiobacteraeota bacterium]
TWDAALIVMGGIIGAGIFVNPAVVAQRAQTTPLILSAWIIGGAIAMLGGFVFAELAARRPEVGGLYAYMRDAFHPSVAFMYGWTALLISQSGGMAIASIAFVLYFDPLAFLHLAPWISHSLSAVGILALFSVINCFGVRGGGTTQNALMVAKIVVFAALIGAGFFIAPPAVNAAEPALAATGFGLIALLATAMIPVLYAYDGWQTANVMSGELKDPARTLSRGLVVGVLAVIALYMIVVIIGLRVLGPIGLAASDAPLTEIMHRAGHVWEVIIKVGVGLSTLGFLSNQVLVSPRIYYAMADDGVFFRTLAWLHPKSLAPVPAIVLQGLAAIVITLIGTINRALLSGYESILNAVTCIDFVFFVLAAVAVFVLRGQDRGKPEPAVRVPLHPWSTALFGVTCAIVVAYAVYEYPRDTVLNFAVLISGFLAYVIWRRFRATRTP